MPSAAGRFFRDNAFLVAAVALPAAVAALFIVATAIPRWTVPAPQHDLVFRAVRSYESSPARIDTEFAVRDGRVQVTVRPAAPNTYLPRWGLFLFDHESSRVREIPLNLPELADGQTSITVTVDALEGMHVSPETTAPDGYALTTSVSGRGGLMGDLFGMGLSRNDVALANRGRVVRLEMPAPYTNLYPSNVLAVGWVVEPGSR